MTRITELAQGNWPSILGALAGLSGTQLTDKHQPCPLCGGKDRYRFDDQDGSGSWYCNKCGGRDSNGGAGSGMDLLMRRTGWTFQEAAQRIEQHLGIAPSAQSLPPRAPNRYGVTATPFWSAAFKARRSALSGGQAVAGNGRRHLLPVHS